MNGLPTPAGYKYEDAQEAWALLAIITGHEEMRPEDCFNDNSARILQLYGYMEMKSGQAIPTLDGVHLANKIYSQHKRDGQ